MLHLHGVILGDSEGLAINVVRWNTFLIGVGALGEIADEQNIDSAKWKTIALLMETLAILQGNVNFDASSLPMLDHVRETTKGRPVTRPGV